MHRKEIWEKTQGGNEWIPLIYQNPKNASWNADASSFTPLFSPFLFYPTHLPICTYKSPTSHLKIYTHRDSIPLVCRLPAKAPSCESYESYAGVLSLHLLLRLLPSAVDAS